MKPLAAYPDAALRTFERPPLPPPDEIEDVYLIGICGKGMGALAELLREAGYAVRGSDEAAYPPMSTRLAALGVPVLEGYDAAHLDPPPGLTVVGNACTPTHVEAAYARDERLVQTSLPGAIGHVFLQERRSLVVAGTHGKTTTTGLLAHVLREAGLDPGFLVGGVLAGMDATGAVGTGPHFVIEGDEYDSAYFDKRPKMLLYRPTGAIVTSLEFDHADIYADWDAYRAAFEAFAGLVGTYGAPLADDAAGGQPGTLVLNGDDAAVRALADHATAAIRTFGLDARCDVTARGARAGEGGQRFDLVVDGEAVADVFLPMSGAHNRMNALAVAALALAEGVGVEEVAAGLATFRGMQRRQEVKGEAGGVLVVDDFAHHPTAVAKTLDAVRERWPARRLVAVFEPRSNSSRRKLFEARYAESFDAADRVFLKTPPLRHNDDAADFLDPDAVAAEVARRGTPAAAYDSVDALLPDLLDALRPGDLALVMSNGSFDGLMGRLLAALEG